MIDNPHSFKYKGTMLNFLGTVLRFFITIALICLFFWVLWQIIKVAILILIFAFICALILKLCDKR